MCTIRGFWPQSTEVAQSARTSLVHPSIHSLFQSTKMGSVSRRIDVIALDRLDIGYWDVYGGLDIEGMEEELEGVKK